MKDRSTLLLALLSANDALGQMAVHRTSLVKQAFLAENIRPLFKIWEQFFAFYRYNHGPYSDDIFERLNALIFNGLVKVEHFKLLPSRTEARYIITDDGNRILQEVAPIQIINLATDLVWSLQALGVEQANTICELVYQEPEFARIFARETETGINAQAKTLLPSITAANNETFIVLASLQEFQKQQSDANGRKFLPSRELVRAFLLSLSVQLQKKKHPEDLAA